MATPCGFDPRHRHQQKNELLSTKIKVRFFMLLGQKWAFSSKIRVKTGFKAVDRLFRSPIFSFSGVKIAKIRGVLFGSLFFCKEQAKNTPHPDSNLLVYFWSVFTPVKTEKVYRFGGFEPETRVFKHFSRCHILPDFLFIHHYISRI